jgi:hypothetical protein
MQAGEVRRAVAAALSTALSHDLTVDDPIVLSNSNKLTLRLLPCDVLARVGPARVKSDTSRSILRNGSRNPGVLWLLLSLEWSHASMSVMAS